MAAPGDKKEGALSLTTEFDAPVPRVRIVIAGHVNGHDVADAFIRLYEEQPEATAYDRLFDLTGYRSGFELEHLQRIAPAYRRAAPDPRHPCRTAFVTHDSHFDLWAQSMGFQFAGREHRAFATFEDAERFLAVPIAQREPFPSA